MQIGGMDLRLRPYPSAAAPPPDPSIYDDAVSLWKLDEASGTRADSIGSNDLTDNNTVGYQNLGPSGTVADFTPANSEYLSNASLSRSYDADEDSLYFCGWIKPDDTGNYQHWFTVGGDWAGVALAVYQLHNTLFAYTHGSVAQPQAAVSGLVYGQWNFIEGYYSLATGKTYVSINRAADTASVDTRAGTSSAYSTLAIAREWGGGWNYYGGGNAASFGFWTSIPDTAIRDSLYNSGKGKRYADLTDDEKVGLQSFWNLDEVSGNRADSHGSNTLTDNNTVQSVSPGPSGIVADFVAANTEWLSGTNQLSGDIDFTVAAWVKIASDADITTIYDAGGPGNFILFLNGANPQLFVRGFAANIISNSAFSLNNWHLVVAYHNAGTDKIGLFVDGVSAATEVSTGGANSAGTILELGRRGTAPDRYFDGLMSRVAVWNRVLTTEEQEALFNSGKGKRYSDLTDAEKVGLVSYWNLDEASGNRADSHGSNTLTDNNTVGSQSNGTPANLPGRVASFVAANDEYFTVAANITNWQSDWTVAYWYKVDAEVDHEFFSVDANLRLRLNLLSWRIIVNGFAEAFQNTTTGSWHLIVFSKKDLGGGVHQYGISHDGAAKTIDDFTSQINSNGSSLDIGRYFGGGVNFDGYASSVAVWARELSDDDIAALYNSGDGAPLP